MSYIPVPGFFRVRMATTANITLSGTQTIDAIVGAANDLVLVKNQSTASQNGLYVMLAGAWSRMLGADNAAELVPGTLVIVQQGTANANSVWTLSTAAPIVIGTTNIAFGLVGQVGATGVALSNVTPVAVGTATAGVGTGASRNDHVHPLNATFTSSADETAVFTSSRQWQAGTNTTVNTTVAGKISIDSTGGGLGPLPATTVTEVNPTANVVGTGVLYARNDHAHFHGEMPGGELHDLVNFAESGLPGFMSVADKSKLDGIEDNATFNEPSNVDPEPIADAVADPGVEQDFARYDHVHAHGERGSGTTAAPLHAVATNEAPGFMAAADHAALALWTPTQCRYFFLDNIAGNDSHVGFLDRSPGHSFTGGEVAAVDAAKIKTVERLLQILPRNGNGRMAKILFKFRSAGTCYLMADGVTLADLDLTGVDGYRWLGRCGSTDLTNTTNDMTAAGGIIAVAGPNGDSSYTALTAGGTGVTIASGSFGTDTDGAGLRVRFQGNVNPDVENLCLPIYRIDSTTQLTYSHPAFPVPDVGDKFFIERVGVTFNNVFDISGAATMSAADQTEMPSPMVGIQAQADTTGGVFRCGAVGKVTYAFCGSRDAGGGAIPRAFSNPDAGHVVLSDGYVDEIGQAWASGPCKFDGTVQLRATTIEVADGGLFCSTTSTSRTVEIKADNLTVGQGNQFKQALALELGSGGPNRFSSGNSHPIRMGATTLVGAALLVRAGSGSLIIDGLTFDSREAVGNYGVIVTGGPRSGVNAETLGSGPNIGFKHIDDNGGGGLSMKGIKLVDVWQGRFYVDETTIGFGSSAGIEVWGTGDNDVTVPFANFGRNNLIDLRGNEIQGSAGRVNTGFVFVQCGSLAVAEGDIVSVLSSSGGINRASIAQAAGDVEYCAGVAINSMPGGFSGFGYIVTHGTPYLVSASGYAPGDIVYLSPTTKGKTVNATPTPAFGVYKIRLGSAVVSSRILLNIQLVGALADGNP